MNAARSTMGEPVPAPPPTILIVEDDVLVRSLVAAYLRECGFDVVEANGADEAIRVLQAEVPIDIVFSDIQMPGSMDGFGLAQWVRRERPWLKVILT
jgi:two-component system, response regulator PdtaR